MPNRILREGILDSDRVNKLSWVAEVFYRRLMSVVDDFGRYDARIELLKSKLYPLKNNQVRPSDIGTWLTECVAAGLVRCYIVDSKNYLEIIDFNQRLRVQKSKFPSPENAKKNDVRQMTDSCTADVGLKRGGGGGGIRNESESESESETRRKEKNSQKSEFHPPELFDVENYFLENGFSKELAYRAFKGYSEADWYDSHGNKIRNWKQKMQHVWFKKEKNVNPDSKTERKIGRIPVSEVERFMQTKTGIAD